MTRRGGAAFVAFVAALAAGCAGLAVWSAPAKVVSAERLGRKTGHGFYDYG